MVWVQENWLLVGVAVAVLAIVLLWLLLASRKTSVTLSPPADGAARRNQALIDAAPAASAPVPTMPPATPAAMGAVAVAVEAQAAPAPVTGNGATADDLTRIKGVGPKLAEQLNALGISELSQIAAWSDADIDRIDAQLGRFQDRIRRDNWPEQARLLGAGDQAAYEAKFGRL